MSFKNKTIWITGASSGIGKAVAHALHGRGAHLILSSRRPKALQHVKQSIEGDTSKVHILPLDLSQTTSLEAKTQQVLKDHGKIDCLFNNGGISQRSLAADTDMEVIRRVMEVNFFGTVALTKAVLPSMISRRSGHIVVTSSVMGKFGTRLRSTYGLPNTPSTAILIPFGKRCMRITSGYHWSAPDI